MPERTLIQFLARVEIVNAVASVAMTIGLLVACLLLDRNYQRLGALEAQLQLRNAQGATSQDLLREAVARLDRLKPPLAVKEVPAR